MATLRETQPAEAGVTSETKQTDDRPVSTLSSEQNPFDSRYNTPISQPSRPNSPTALQNTGPNPTVLGRQLSATSLKRRSSYAPVAPSPLNPSSSQTSVDASNENPSNLDDVSPRDSSSSGEDPSSQSSGKSPAVVKARRTTSGLSPAQQILRQKSALALRPENPTQSEAPRRLKDLGRDYSRYPFSSDTRSSSGITLAAAAVATAASEVSLLRTTTRNPFSDSQADLEKWGYPDDSIGSFNPYHGGEKGFILYSNELEADDKLHMPADDDDLTYKTRWSDYFGRRQIVSTIGGFFLILGLLCIFIVLPVLTYSTNVLAPGHDSDFDPNDFGPAWAHVNNRTYPAMQNIRRDLIDPDTPASAYTRKSSFDTSELNLVFSDEFNTPGRTFYPEDDPYWTGADIWYGATQDFEWYDPDAITTANGTLQLRLDAFANHGLQYRSGMLNSWNQMCFKGGVYEVSVSLAGPSGVPGLWPGVWSMGNLGRPGYKATTEGVWPYTYNGCDAGITPNQSDTNGLSHLPGQKLTACVCNGEDHPSPGTGRGAPELDILEGSVDPVNKIGVVTQSLQVAPFDVFYRPNSAWLALPDYNTTQMNGYCGGPFQQAVSATTLLNNGWYDGKAYQKYAYEYVPGQAPTGKIAWFVGENPTFIMDGHAIGPNGNVGARQVPEEPMSMVLNLGYSAAWTQIDAANLRFPTVMHVDYVRVYQKPGQESVTCDPPGYPTTQYIADHPIAYQNPNLTVSAAADGTLKPFLIIEQKWDQTGYGWPKNKLTGC
ncbi:beta-glucan synthesis-associated protein-domain-containing protein [Amylocarpus encephaloides]|uniref:Beta-glucan synthesis-associated protein-domain-containing protein n=1 Tax=Amylocarpus encephaloides TaxID=45428 RepID=A0A9P7YSD1_9HELO|nr:beta-glucan synthesis-associated protein-domain-containing protein [Amylocarpus encephaloides]